MLLLFPISLVYKNYRTAREKSGSRTVTTNYRPISFMSKCCSRLTCFHMRGMRWHGPSQPRAQRCALRRSRHVSVLVLLHDLTPRPRRQHQAEPTGQEQNARRRRRLLARTRTRSPGHPCHHPPSATQPRVKGQRSHRIIRAWGECMMQRIGTWGQESLSKLQWMRF